METLNGEDTEVIEEEEDETKRSMKLILKSNIRICSNLWSELLIFKLKVE